MLERIKNSLAYRLPHIYKMYVKYIFKTKNQKSLPKTNNYNLVILSGHAQLEMLNACLNSIYNSFKKVPNIYIFVDFSLNSIDCQKSISQFAEGDITIIEALSCMRHHRDEGNYLLTQFASQNPMGLKLAAVLQVITLGLPVLYCDTDVIWHKDPISELNNLIKSSNFHLALSVDFQSSYDDNLINRFNLDELNRAPYYCAGIIFIKKLSKKHLATISDFLPELTSQSNHFSEQTVFAWLNRLSGDFCLDKNKFIIELDDKLDFIPKKRPEMIARHYVGEIRHLFWRDYIFKNIN